MVIASRFARGGQVGVSHYRAFISICANNFMNFFRIPGVKEYFGFRGYKAECIKKVRFTAITSPIKRLRVHLYSRKIDKVSSSEKGLRRYVCIALDQKA